MKTLKTALINLMICITLFGCSKKEASPLDPLVGNRDTIINPANDFFNYANNGWFKKNPIPNSESSNGIWKTILDTIDSQIKDICVKAADDVSAPKGSNNQKIGDFYASGMDTIAIEKAGLSPLNKEIERIKGIKDINSLVETIAHLKTIGSASAFSFTVSQDNKKSSEYALFFNQSGLGLGEREYYLDTDEHNIHIRKEYGNHLKAMMKFLGQNDDLATKSAGSILKMETELAKSSRKLEELRDEIKNYNKYTIDQFNKLTPDIDWKKILPVLGIVKAETVIVGQPEFFAALDSMLKSYSIADWKVYLQWQLLNSYATYLDKGIEKQNFKFFGTVMNGIAKQKPRWKSIVSETDNSLGELIGQVYVADYLPKGAKEKLLEIGNAVREEYAQRIKKLDWMSPDTKKKALVKLDKIVMKVGYPDKWKDLSTLKVDRNFYCSNVMNASIWKYKDMVSKYGKPVDRKEWAMQPQTYNAYYNPSNNEIVVPACNIMIPGFEGRMPDDAVLYAIIGGSIFGHEITHGFDDQGSQYDADGNLNNWWTKTDLIKFKNKTNLIVSQYSDYTVLNGKHINGSATQGENIADLAGVIVGLEAFKKTEQYKNKQIINGLNPEQRYFLSYAYGWMINRTDEALLSKVMTDVHSPEQYRVNGPLSNIPEFYSAFKVKKGNKMYRPDDQQVFIW